jgi:hypothetical protein
MSRSLKVACCPSTTECVIQFGFDTIEGDSDCELVLYCFQEGFSEVTNANHLPSATAGDVSEEGKERI